MNRLSFFKRWWLRGALIVVALAFATGGAATLAVIRYLDSPLALDEPVVITVEPGLYVEEEAIGIRIENDVCITEDGCEDLSHNIPKTVEEIEALMAK